MFVFEWLNNQLLKSVLPVPGFRLVLSFNF